MIMLILVSIIAIVSGTYYYIQDRKEEKRHSSKK